MFRRRGERALNRKKVELLGGGDRPWVPRGAPLIKTIKCVIRDNVTSQVSIESPEIAIRTKYMRNPIRKVCVATEAAQG